MKLYHWTSERQLGAILKRGLVPQVSPDTELEGKKVIYLSRWPLSWASDYLKDLEYSFGGEPVVLLELDLPKGWPLHQDPTMDYSDNYVFTQRGIPPSYIKRVLKGSELAPTPGNEGKFTNEYYKALGFSEGNR